MSDAPQTPTSLSSRVNSIAAHLANRGALLSGGDVAMLRRMDPHTLSAPGFFKLAGTVLADDLPRGGEPRDEAEVRWAAVIVALAHLGELHRPGQRLGAALAHAGYSESRFVRLLRADGERLVDELPAMARYLAAKSVAADFTEAARLLLSAGRVDAEKTRRRLARDYYDALDKRDTTTQD